MPTKLFPALLAIASIACGATVFSQSELAASLSTSGIVDTFNTFGVASGTSTAINCALLTAGTTCNGQGPSLVASGAQFSFGSGGGQWDGSGYYGSTSGEIVGRQNTSGTPAPQMLTITFTMPVTTLGLDIRAFTGYAATATVTIFGMDDHTVIGVMQNINLNANGSSVFAGWQDMAGIGKVQLSQTGEYWSPVLDFLEYGASSNVQPSVPEPASLILVGLGLLGIALRRGRRFVPRGL